MEIKDRISEFIRYKSITIAEFERNVDLANGYIKKFKGSIGSDKLNNIVSYYPEINIDWLITGKGSMLKSESPSQGSQQSGSDYTLIEELKEEISALKAENNQLKGENKVLRELAGLGERKESGEQSA